MLRISACTPPDDASPTLRLPMLEMSSHNAEGKAAHSCCLMQRAEARGAAVLSTVELPRHDSGGAAHAATQSAGSDHPRLVNRPSAVHLIALIYDVFEALQHEG